MTNPTNPGGMGTGEAGDVERAAGTSCAHENTKRGSNIPRRYGSYRSEVCLSCGSFRALTHFDDPVGPWRDKKEYEQATAEMDDE